jgi:hypothetical protein
MNLPEIGFKGILCFAEYIRTNLMMGVTDIEA